MNVIRPALLFFLLCAVGAQAFAQAPPGKTEVRRLLLGEKYAELDQKFGDIQRAYANGKMPEEDLRAAFRVFYDPDQMFMGTYERWVTHSPKSYAAHLARGIYMKNVGIERRGGALAADTKPEQWAGMRAAHAVARKEFETSLKLDRKPLLTYLHFIDVSLYEGKQDECRRLLDQALALAPKTFITREKYLSTLQTKWGGSEQQMRAFIEESRVAGLNASQMARLHAILQRDIAWKQEAIGDLEGALRSYQTIALLQPDSDCPRCGVGYNRARLFSQQKQYGKALDELTMYLKHEPDDVDALHLRGSLYVELKKGPEARTDLQRAAKLRHPESQILLAKLLLDGGLIPENREEAIRLLEKASKKGYTEANEILMYAYHPKSVIKIKPKK